MIKKLWKFIKHHIRSMLPITGEHTAVSARIIRDIRILPFLINPRRRSLVISSFRQCRTFDDYFQFTKNWLYGGAMQHPEEIGKAIDLMRPLRPLWICEIGTANGGTSILLSQVLDSVKTFIGIDLYIMNSPYLRLLHRPSQRIHLINGSSYGKNTISRVSKILGNQQIDVLFIDGDHRYEGAKQDFMLYRKFVRDGGLIMFHDIVPDKTSISSPASGLWAGEVPLLWKRIKRLYPYHELIHDKNQSGLGIGVIHYSSKTILPQEFINSTEIDE